MDKKKPVTRSTAKKNPRTTGATAVDPFAATVEETVPRSQVVADGKRAIKVIKRAASSSMTKGDATRMSNDAFAEPVSAPVAITHHVEETPDEVVKPKKVRAKRMPVDKAPALKSETTRKSKTKPTGKNEMIAEADQPKKARAKSAVKSSATASGVELPKKTSRKRVAKADEPETILELPETAVPNLRKRRETIAPETDPIEIVEINAGLSAKGSKIELSPVFKALADVKLPEIEHPTRGRLLMQSPTKLYFYWGVKQNPWHQLRRIFGDDLGSYALVLKLTELNSGREEMQLCDAAGNWWFDVEPDGKYQAEVGFYAPNRPYFRILYSNVIETPRRSPSPHPADEARWTVSATKFAEVLDVAGFTRDAFDVAMAGDDLLLAEDTSFTAFKQFIGNAEERLDGISAEDVRHAMLALAAGVTLEELRWRVSASLFAILQAHAGKLGKAEARTTLSQHFDMDESGWTEEQFGPAVYGASLVNFPRTLKARKDRTLSPASAARYQPISSHTLP